MDITTIRFFDHSVQSDPAKAKFAFQFCDQLCVVQREETSGKRPLSRTGQLL